jgi:hypothetical protein
VNRKTYKVNPKYITFSHDSQHQTALTAVMYRKPQLIRLMCLECQCRFIKAVTHWRQIHLREQRKAEVAAIRCPACGSDKCATETIKSSP